MLPRYGDTRTPYLEKTLRAGLPDGYRLLGPTSSHPDVLYLENFLTAEQCDQLAQCFERHRQLAPKSRNPDPLFDYRVIHFASIPDEEDDCKSIMQSSRFDTAAKLNHLFGVNENLYSDDVQLVKWSPGQPMRPHADNAHPDGGPHRTPHREFASVVYLNDDFIGGYLYFEKLKVAVAPKKGLLVAFKGGMEHMHGVTEIVTGNRYTMPAWFTRNIERRDRTELTWRPRAKLQGEAEPTLDASDDPLPRRKAPYIGKRVGLRCYAMQPSPPRLVPANPLRDWMDAMPGRHAYRCLPMAIANTYGWELLTPCAFSVEWTGGLEKGDLRVLPEDDYPYLSHFAESNFTHGIVTLHTGYLFQTDPGWHLVATGPFNNPKNGIAPLSGVIETDWLPYTFTMNWRMTAPGTVRFEKDEPFCLIFPVVQETLEATTPEIYNLADNPELCAEHLAWAQSRGAFRKRLEQKEPEALKQAWQKYYFKAKSPDGSSMPVPSHTQKLRVRPPVDKRKK